MTHMPPGWARFAPRQGISGKLFATEPAKFWPGYPDFAKAEPSLRLVLIEHRDGRAHGTAWAPNHLGAEVETPAHVPEEQESTTFGCAVQDHAWSMIPTGRPGRCTPADVSQRPTWGAPLRRASPSRYP
jgi:hypothetical protein